MATNSKDIFDEITFEDQEESPSTDIFDEITVESSPKKAAKIGAKSFLSSLGGTYGDILDLLGIQSRGTLPGEQAQRDLELQTLNKMQEEGYKPTVYDFLSLSDDDDILPRYSRLPSSEELEEVLGKEKPETFAERLAQRGGRALGGAGALGGGGIKTLLSLLTGSTAGTAAEELGFPQEVADIVDIGATIGSGGAAKGLIPKKNQKEIVEALKKKGFTDAQITPLIQSEKKLRQLGKFAAKDEKVGNRLVNIKEKIGDIYETVKEKGKSLKPLSGTNIEKFEDSLGTILDDIRPMYRRLIQDEVHDLANSSHSLKDLINFYQDINAKVKGVEGGKSILNKLKKPVLTALHDIDPEAAKDFNLANQLYSKLFKTAKALKPKQLDDLLGLGELYGVGAGLASGNVGILTKAASGIGGRALARELLINPKLQNFSKQIAQQIKKNKKSGILKSTQKAMDYLKENRPDIFEEIKVSES